MPGAAPIRRDAARPGSCLLALLLACAPRSAEHKEPTPPGGAGRPVRAAPSPAPDPDARLADPLVADADADGIADVDDLCPDEAEAGGGDHDGCPDPSRLVIICQRPIRGVNFGTGSPGPLDPASLPVLDEVAAILREHPDLRLRVVGHADPHESSDEADRRARARARAQRVQEELARRGADPSRLEVVSDGSSHPVDGRDTPEARARNRRVEFRVVEADPAATGAPP